MRTVRPLLLVVLCVFFILAAAPQPRAAGAQTAVPTLAARARPLPYLPGAPPARTSLAESEFDLPAPLEQWSFGVFQRLMRSGDWDVFSAYPPYQWDKPRPNLTNHPANDIQPRLDRGARRVVFASDRVATDENEDDYDLFVMNVDGSGLRRLVASPATDMMPAWAPDGRSLLFTSDRDGQAEIYRVNADGSGLQRLTTHPAYDASPAWSPDGARITFVSTRDGGQYIYTMDADGRNVRRVSSYPNSDNPVWSPNGRNIAFDTDRNGDGLSGVAVMEADGSYPWMLEPEGPAITVMANSWSPDSAYVVYTVLYLQKVNGAWYWTESKVQARSLKGHDHLSWLPIDVDTGWSVDWQTLDDLPPVSAISALPRYSRPDQLGLRWHAADAGKAGLRAFDLQTQTNGAAWQPWLEGTTRTYGRGTAVPGETFAARVRAVDQAFNAEPWTRGLPAQTTVFRHLLGGQVTDNRGAPLGELPLALSPAAPAALQTDADGRFYGRTFQPGPQALSAAADGLAPLPNTPWPAGQDLWRDFVLRPAADLITNGGFEAGAGPPAGWTVSGALPAVVQAGGASGRGSLRLGSLPAPWQPGPWQETPAPRVDAAVVDSAGNLHLVWQTRFDPQPQWWHAWRSPDGAWSAPQAFAPFTFGIPTAVLRADAQGQVHLARQDGAAIVYQLWRPAAGWSRPRTLAVNTGDYLIELFDMALSPGGAVDVLGRNGPLTIWQRHADGAWERPAYPQAPYNFWLQSPSLLALRRDGSLHLFYTTYPDSAAELPATLYTQVRPPGGDWQPPLPLLEVPGPTYIYVWAALADANDTLHAFVAQGDALYHLTQTLNQPWDKPQRVAPDLAFTPYFYDVAPAVAADQEGYLHLLFGEETQLLPQVMMRWHNGSGWSAPAAWPAGPRARMLLLDQADSLALLSLPQTPEGPVYAAAAAPAGGAAQAALAQTISIPAEMPYPTLSFMARGYGDRRADGTALQVTLAAGAQTAVSRSFALSKRWQLYWLDAGALAGQTVTATFALQQEAAGPPLTVWLDDIALGAAGPETAVSATVLPAQALPGQLATITLTAHNPGGLDGPQARLSLTLDPALQFGAADPPPQQSDPLRWELGTLAAGEARTVTVQVRLAGRHPPGKPLPAVAQLDVHGEVYTGNNRAQTAVRSGAAGYMPVVTGSGP